MGQTEKKYIDDLLDGLYGVEGSFTQPAIFDAIEKAGAITTAITDNRVFNVTGIGVVEIWNIADIFKDIAEIGRAIDGSGKCTCFGSFFGYGFKSRW